MTEAEFKKVSSEHRGNMLTVQKLIDFLKTCNPNACVLGFEVNSNAYIEQLPNLPNHLISTVADDKKREEELLNQWYDGYEDKAFRIKNQMDEIYRYAKDDDVVINL